MSADTEVDDTDPNTEESLQKIRQLAASQIEAMRRGEVPQFEVPTRSKTNITADERGVYSLGERASERSPSDVSGAKKYARIAFTMEFLERQLSEGRSSTLRELYYLSESWDVDAAQFNSQDQSNRIIEELETALNIRREDMHMRPEESGATIIGPLELREQTRRGEREIHCQKTVGEGGYQIPNDPDSIEFLDHDAEFILCVETGGMRDRLVENGFDTEMDVIIVHLKGQPSRATRRITKRLHNELSLPVTVFTDSDPWSYRIFGSVAYGSINTAHLSDYLTTPEAQFIGIRPRDIQKYDLPTDPLSDSDIKALESELEDPRFQSDFWREEIELQLDLGKKAEQQALASQGLDFVTDTYLPERLSEMDII